jgi:hypothetical protein
MAAKRLADSAASTQPETEFTAGVSATGDVVMVRINASTYRACTNTTHTHTHTHTRLETPVLPLVHQNLDFM